MGKRLLVLFVVLSMCLGPVGPTLGMEEGGSTRSITPFDSDPAWYDALDDMSQVYVPPGGLVGVEVAGGEARLLAGHDEGWIASSVISCPPGFRYDLVLLEADLPGASYMNITILNASAAPLSTAFANATVPGFVNITGTDASVFRVGRVAFPKVRIQVNLFASGTDRPRLLSWSLRFINLDEWRDDFLGTGKMSNVKGLNITGGRAELNLSRGGVSTYYDKYPPVLLANNDNWLDVYYPNAGNTGYSDIEEIANVDYTQQIAIDELNNDGYLDVVCAMGEEIANVDCKILWGGASGKWSVTDSDTIDTPADMVETGDLNGDGDVDVVLVNRGIGRGQGMMIFLNQGLGEFPAKPDIEFQNLNLLGLATGDVNNDGYDDLMLWESTFKANCYYGGPSGPDTTPDVTYLDEYTSASSSGIRTVLLDDFDADGYLDVTFNTKFGSPTSEVPVYLGSSSGIDDTSDLQLAFDDYPYTFDAGDIDLDGYPDLVVSTAGSTTDYGIDIWKGSSNIWTKNNIHTIDIPERANQLRVADIDRDGFADIVTTDETNLKVYKGGPSWPTTYTISKDGAWIPTDLEVAIPKGAGYGLAGSFLTRSIPIPVGKVWDILRVDADLPEGTEMTITVLDTGKRPIPGLEELPGPDLDLSVIENWRSIFVKVHIWSESNQSTPSLDQLLVNWMDPFTWRDHFYGRAKFASNLGLDVIDDQLRGSSDGRGTADIVFANMRNNAGYDDVDSLGFVDAGDLDYSSIKPVGMSTGGAVAVDAHDVDGDGIQDLVFASYGKVVGNLVGDSPVYLGTSTGWYDVPLHTFSTMAAMDVVMDDLNDDGYADVVFSQEQDWSGWGAESPLYWGSADGWSATPDVEFETSGASGVEAVDVDDDGLLDLVFACYRDAAMTTDSMVFLQDSAGFCGTEPDHYLETVGARAVASGDLDEDGNLDLVFACHHDGESYAVDSRVYWGQAGGGFGTTPTELPTLGAMDVEVADLDGDGHLDIAFANNRNATSGYLGAAYLYLNDGSGGFGPTPSVTLPTEGATAVEAADLDGTGHMDLVFACSNNGTTFRVPSVIYLGGASGWPNGPDILLPTVGAMDSMAMLLSDPDLGGYVSEAITPDEKDDIGAFHTLSYDATLDASHSATLHVIDAVSGETLFETAIVSGNQELDMRRAFHYQVHPSVRILITVEGLGGGGGFTIDDLRLNWTKRVLTPPEVIEASLTATSCYRTQSVEVLIDVYDEYDPADTLKVTVTHQLVGTMEWSTSMRGIPVYEDGLWRVEMAPDRYTPLGEYVFRVTAEDSDRMSSIEVLLEDTLEVLPNLPGPPVLLEAAFGDSKVDLSWNAPEVTGDLPVEGYWVHRGITEDALEQLVMIDALSTTYTDTGLVNGQTYYYAIHAFNDLGDSPLSSVLSAMPAGLPGMPTNLVGESGDGRVTLTWEPPLRDGGMPVLSYYVYRSIGDGDLEPLSDAVGLTFEDSMVTNGETYGYSVAALNALGEGPGTEDLYIMPLGVPGAPGDLVLEVDQQSLGITWLEPLDTGGGAITGYVLYRGEDPDDLRFLTQVGSLVLDYVDEDVTVGTTYHYAVAAVTDGGEGPMSIRVSGVPIDLPGAPSDLVAEGEDGQVVLTWSAPADIGGTAITGYVVMRGFSAESLTRLATLDYVNTFTDTLVTNGETYWYALIAVNVVGEGDPTEAVEAEPMAPPTAPGKVPSLVAEVKGDRVELRWVAPISDGGSDITGYVIYRGTSRDDLVEIARPGLVLTYVDEDVKPGKTYFYSVAAINVAGQGEEHAPLKAALEEDEEASLPVLPIALAIVAVVVVLLVVLFMRRGKAAPAGEEGPITDDEVEGGDETEDAEAEEEAAEAEETEVDEEGGGPPRPGEGKVAPEDDWSHPEIEVEIREVN